MKFDATEFARGWLSVALAASTDKDRPQLYKAVFVEQYPTGVRLTSTDSYMILTAWVPAGHDWSVPEPPADEEPMTTAIAVDADGRAKGLLTYTLALAARSDTDDAAQAVPDISLDLGVLMVEDEDGAGGVFAGMESRWAVIDLPDFERVKLRLHEGEFPNCRQVLDGFVGEDTKAVTLNPEIVARLAKIAKVQPLAKLRWWFGGEDRMARLEVVDSEPHISGGVMPIRNLDTPPPDPEDGEQTAWTGTGEEWAEAVKSAAERGDTIDVEATLETSDGTVIDMRTGEVLEGAES